jgi:tRNA(Ile)-lysidine synthase
LVEVSSDGTTLAVRRVTARKAAVEYEFALAPGQVVETSAGGWHVSAGLIEARDAVQRHTQHVAITPGRTPVLVVRNRRRGDRFKPLGMREEKKLSDFFIDRKIPSDIRDTLPLVLIDDRIAWIAGIEVSDDFRLGRGDAERLVLSAWRVGDER